MSRRREQALRERVIRGSTEGEREAALNALVKAVPAEVSPVKPHRLGLRRGRLRVVREVVRAVSRRLEQLVLAGVG